MRWETKKHLLLKLHTKENHHKCITKESKSSGRKCLAILWMIIVQNIITSSEFNKALACINVMITMNNKQCVYDKKEKEDMVRGSNWKLKVFANEEVY